MLLNHLELDLPACLQKQRLSMQGRCSSGGLKHLSVISDEKEMLKMTVTIIILLKSPDVDW